MGLHKCSVYTELCPESEEILAGDTSVLSYIPVKKSYGNTLAIFTSPQ